MNTNYISIESLSPLYEAVQLQPVFPDSKYFVDCIPDKEPAVIVKAYLEEKNKPGFDLKAFVAAHFHYPPQVDTGYHSENKPLNQHLNDLWDVLKRPPTMHTGSTLIPLPHPYIVPGGRFREVYYWDSYFTMLGLQVSGRKDIMKNMVDNFAALIQTIGFIPNANRSYYLGRSQPPFFTMMVQLLAESLGHEMLPKYQPAIEQEYAFWMNGTELLNEQCQAYRRVVLLPDGSILNRYWDDKSTPRPEAYIEDIELAAAAPGKREDTYRHIRAAAESGWDFSTRWFADGMQMKTIQTTELIPIDLNCLLLFTEETLRDIAIYNGQTAKAREYQDIITRRRKAIEHYCYDAKEGYYFDYQFVQQKKSMQPTLAGAYALFFGVCAPENAARVASFIETHFLHPGGVVTTLVKSGQQWDAPNGWAPLQWITYKGLQDYGFDTIARKLRNNWMQVNEHVYAASGKMMEKYNVMDTGAVAGGGEYPNQDGFGWTNGVYLRLQQEQQNDIITGQKIGA